MITTPYSLELTKNQDAKDAIAGTSTAVVPLKMKIYLGGNVIPGKIQTYIGTLQAVARAMSGKVLQSAGTGAVVGYGDWRNAVAGNIVLAADVTGVTADHVAIIVSGTFDTQAATHFYDETFKQLLNVLLEKTSTN